MILSKNGESVYNYAPVYSGRKIVVGIDSSKSNTAIVVGDEKGNILDDYEISGAGSDVNVYQLCWDTRRALSTLFDNAEILKVGIENIITKQEKGYKGIEVHQSRAKITAVFDNLIFFFQDRHNIMPELINNQEWKAATLPEEYRKRTHKKGSKDFFMDIGSPWGNRKDDVTDAVMIYKYVVSKSNFKITYSVTETTPYSNKYAWGIYPKSMKFEGRVKEFIIENTDTLEHNLNSIANRLDVNEIGITRYDSSLLDINDIYSDKLQFTANCRYEMGDSEVIILVIRDEVS